MIHDKMNEIELANEIAALYREIGKLQTSCQDLQMEVDHSRERIDTLEGQLAELEEKLEEAE